MDLSKILIALVAFGAGLCLGGVLEVGALFLCYCILFGFYFLATAVLNGLAGLQPPVQEEEPRNPIGYPTNYVEVGDDD